jgi:plasmid stabilization system protein ParE
VSAYRLTELANNDLWEIRHRVLEDSGAAVLRRIMIELDAKLKLLCEFPGIGRARPEFTDESVFFVPFYSWFIVYVPGTEPLEIVRLLSARRNMTDVL